MDARAALEDDRDAQAAQRAHVRTWPLAADLPAAAAQVNDRLGHDVSGDALVTGHAVSRRKGPQLLPSVFNHDDERCRRSLDALALLDTDILLPGHGPLWRGPIREAVEEALG